HRKFESFTMKDFIDPYFFTTPFEQWKLSSFIETCSGPGFVKRDCLYSYKEGLQNIRKSSEFDDEQKTMALKLIENYKVDKKKCAELLKTHENQVIAHSTRSGILRDRFELLANTARSANSTIYTTFTQADAFVTGHKVQEKQITADYDFLTIDPNSESSQGIKRDLDEVDEEEYDAELTIVGGKSTSWVVNGINIRQKLTGYQETGLPKTRPEYYDVILFTDKNQDGFLGTLEESVVVQMRKEIERKDEKTEDNIEQKIKQFLNNIITRDIKETKENLKLLRNDTFEENFAIFFVNHMIELIEDLNVLLEDMSEGTFIAMVLAPILNRLFIKNKKVWYAKYGETCLRANAEEQNSQKTDDERRSPGEKIDTIITLRNEDEEFSVTEVSGPPSKKDWTHFIGDRLKIIKMSKTLMNRFARLRPNSDIRTVSLYGMQIYLYQVILYEFRLKFSEIYTVKELLRFSIPKTWKDMRNSHEAIIGFLKYEHLLSESSSTIEDFLWKEDNGNEDFRGMTTRTIYTSKCIK
ncbi:13083_t:CDS:2, partial [Acaulospora morrowiae]